MLSGPFFSFPSWLVWRVLNHVPSLHRMGNGILAQARLNLSIIRVHDQQIPH